MSATQGFLMYYSLWRNDQDLISWVSAVEGCPLSRVSLYVKHLMYIVHTE